MSLVSFNQHSSTKCSISHLILMVSMTISSLTFLQSVSCFLMILSFQCHYTLLTFSKSSPSLQTIINNKYSTPYKVRHTQLNVTSMTNLCDKSCTVNMKMLKAFYQKQEVTVQELQWSSTAWSKHYSYSIHTNNTLEHLEAVQAATTVIMNFIQQKFIMLGIDVESSTTDVLTTQVC